MPAKFSAPAFLPHHIEAKGVYNSLCKSEIVDIFQDRFKNP